MPRTPFRVLFVCLGNICRSPAGENILRHLARQEDMESMLEIDSAGTHAYHIGKKPDSRMTTALSKHGIDNPGSGRQFSKDDFEHFDLILAMDSENLANIHALDPAEKYHHKVKRMTAFCSQPEFQIPDVPDPYYGGEEGFHFVTDLLLDGCLHVITHARKQLHHADTPEN